MQASANKIPSLAKSLQISSESQFSLFSMLPVELRLKIWNMALPGQRIVEVYLDYVTDLGTGCSTNALKVNTPPPSLMHVNFESRTVALEKYWLRLGNETLSGYNPRIDPAGDIIFIPWSFDNPGSRLQELINGRAWSKEAKESIRYMAVDESTWRDLNGPGGFIYFERLEKYTVIAHNSSSPCLEGWRNGGTEIAFMDLEDDDREEIIHDRYVSVVDQMEFDNEYYKREWKLPAVEVKVVARGRKKCCY
ncbi:hypothetical protein N431DRAFT_493090 [Stipitochalara longipes BDJ]|nr:hypothetical protein N431DRAFT_493090 [Stipitochalara longipes BDJ]